MLDTNLTVPLNKEAAKSEPFVNTLRKSSKKIAPVWPLESFVAVNPYLGLSERKFDNVAHELNLMGGVNMTMPTSFYLKKIEEGKLTLNHIAEILVRKQIEMNPTDFMNSLDRSGSTDENLERIQNVADVAGALTNKDWNRLILSRVSAFAATFFDKGQAILSPTIQDECLYKEWKEEALIDRTPEIMGLKNFRKIVKTFPDNPVDASRVALDILRIPKDGEEVFLHALLLRTSGWSAFAAQIDWDNELYGKKDGKVIEFLAVLLCWEACIYSCVQHDKLASEWDLAIAKLTQYSQNRPENNALKANLILQEAFDLAEQSEIVNAFNSKDLSTLEGKKESKAQAIFCIDVRSEVYRRNLEMVDNEIETLGFAGFFGFPIQYVPLGNEVGEAQCPVLLKVGHTIVEEMSDKDANQAVLKNRLLYRQFQQTWKSFKSGAITCFGYVSPMGLSFLPKLFTDSFGFTRPVPHPNQAGVKSKFTKSTTANLTVKYNESNSTGIPLQSQIQMAKNALTAMSLTDDFSRLVLIVGHGSTMVNNPHATGYDCGACGGHTGEANAKVAAEVLNSREVREGLQKENIFIPVNTLFLSCLHDTTTDEMTIFNESVVPEERKEELKELKNSLRKASSNARGERVLKLDFKKKLDSTKSILSRSKDWSQTRPEWGLAGCSSFIVAPRGRTKNIDFKGRSFLHSYNWKNDNGFSVLEQIMTAPMVVTSWISLQYYASTVDNKVYGSGNKTLHNVTSGLGVLEGFTGDLRVGLPWQAIHDGEMYRHDPVRLNVIIEAPVEAINTILAKHNSIKDLVDNNWINLLAMNEDGKVSKRYQGGLTWENIN